jgi:hypothetical protein
MVRTFESGTRLEMLHDWRESLESLLLIGILAGIMLFATIYSVVTDHPSVNFFGLFTGIFALIFFGFLTNRQKIEFDLAENRWQIDHFIFFIPIRKIYGKMVNVSQLTVVKGVDSKWNPAETRGISSFRSKFQARLELWGFIKADGERSKFLLFGKHVYSEHLCDREVSHYITVGLQAIEFFKKFGLPIDIENIIRQTGALSSANTLQKPPLSPFPETPTSEKQSEFPSYDQDRDIDDDASLK